MGPEASKSERKAAAHAPKAKRENPGNDRPLQGRNPGPDHAGHRFAGAQRPRIHFHRRQKAQRHNRVLKERSWRPHLYNRQVEAIHFFPRQATGKLKTVQT